MLNKKEEVLAYMREYQNIFIKPPTLQDIARGVEGLNWRSSVRYTLESLLSDGRVELVAPSGYSRRYRLP